MKQQPAPWFEKPGREDIAAARCVRVVLANLDALSPTRRVDALRALRDRYRADWLRMADEDRRDEVKQ